MFVNNIQIFVPAAVNVRVYTAFYCPIDGIQQFISLLSWFILVDKTDMLVLKICALGGHICKNVPILRLCKRCVLDFEYIPILKAHKQEVKPMKIKHASSIFRNYYKKIKIYKNDIKCEIFFGFGLVSYILNFPQLICVVNQDGG